VKDGTPLSLRRAQMPDASNAAEGR